MAAQRDFLTAVLACLPACLPATGVIFLLISLVWLHNSFAVTKLTHILLALERPDSTTEVAGEGQGKQTKTGKKRTR
jgi:hypothetical protein